MSYVIHKEEKTPAYLQLYLQLREDIVAGVYPYGVKIPSKRMLAEESGISTVTAEHALAMLCDEGYIEARERSGCFVIFRESDGFSGIEKNPAVLPVQTVHTETEFPFSVLAKTMRRVITERSEALLERSPSFGCDELRKEISRYLARSRGIHAEPARIIIGSGSEYLYGLIVELLGRECIYAMESPSYEKIEQVYRAADVTCDLLQLGSDGVESAELRRTCADVLHITPYRSFPSGVTATASKRHEYLRWAERKGRYIVEDDFESEFSVSRKPEETLFSNTHMDNVIYMNTFSKTISASMRVGYMVIPKHLTERAEKKLGFYSCTVPTFEQYVLAELIGKGDFERHINRVRRTKRKELKLQ